MQKLSFQRWLQIATEVFRKDSRKDAWLSSYQESNKLTQRINSSCSSSKTKSRSTKSNSKSTQVHSRLRKKNVYWATHKRSVNFSFQRRASPRPEARKQKTMHRIKGVHGPVLHRLREKFKNQAPQGRELGIPAALKSRERQLTNQGASGSPNQL